MTVKIVFFASLREKLGVNSVDLQISDSSCVSSLISQLADQYSAEWLAILAAENIRIAVNQGIISEDVGGPGIDKKAIFPPVTGG